MKDSKRSREGAQTQWWTQILQVSKEFWKYLSSLDKPSLKRKNEMDRVKAENGEITKTIDEAVAVQTRWCKRVACTDWAAEIGIEPSEEEERFSSLFCVFQEWRGVAIESKWTREDENGERSTLNQVCNDDLLETELDIGLKRAVLERQVEPTISPMRLLFRWIEQINDISRTFGPLSLGTPAPRQSGRKVRKSTLTRKKRLACWTRSAGSRFFPFMGRSTTTRLRRDLTSSSAQLLRGRKARPKVSVACLRF